ncbi:hypothetical protein ACE5IS_17305 [Leptospira wolffii]|uniref:Tetratricopeptide repeat protein n=1 Tax=Leptospira wolffii TaxID=409998 RepID=A0ABV5BSI7_9LEPT|nr:hypothetical protein [Leptospira wolffii]TGL51776.1 hypothetical protein EHQ61_07375 [Leptospira wolffii]
MKIRSLFLFPFFLFSFHNCLTLSSSWIGSEWDEHKVRGRRIGSDIGLVLDLAASVSIGGGPGIAYGILALGSRGILGSASSHLSTMRIEVPVKGKKYELEIQYCLDDYERPIGRLLWKSYYLLDSEKSDLGEADRKVREAVRSSGGIDACPVLDLGYLRLIRGNFAEGIDLIRSALILHSVKPSLNSLHVRSAKSVLDWADESAIESIF